MRQEPTWVILLSHVSKKVNCWGFSCLWSSKKRIRNWFVKQIDWNLDTQMRQNMSKPHHFQPLPCDQPQSARAGWMLLLHWEFPTPETNSVLLSSPFFQFSQATAALKARSPKRTKAPLTTEQNKVPRLVGRHKIVGCTSKSATGGLPKQNGNAMLYGTLVMRGLANFSQT